MTTFNCLLFGPGLDPAGTPGEARLGDGRLTVRAGEVRVSIPAAEVEVAAAGVDGGQWRLEWDSPAGRMAAVPSAGGLEAAALARWSPDLAERFRQARGRLQGRRRRLALAALLLALVLLLPFFLVGVFWLNADRVAGWAAGQVSLEQEARLGEMAFAQMRPGLKLLESGPAPAMVAALGSRLTAGSAYRYQWYVAVDPRINAFALPGGHVVVCTGLIRAAESAEEVAGVLAHEVQHVEMRHALKNLLHGLGWRALLALALGDLSGGVWAGMAEQLGRLGYSRDLERQADLGGLEALRRAGIAPQGMASLFARLARQDGGQIELLSTHPASAARLQALQQAISAQGADAASPLPYDWGALQASLPAEAP